MLSGDRRAHGADPPGRAHLPADAGAPTGSAGDRPYTPAMRRWVCIVALLAGFAREDYVRGARLPSARRDRASDRTETGGRGLVPTGAWWMRADG